MRTLWERERRTLAGSAKSDVLKKLFPGIGKVTNHVRVAKIIFSWSKWFVTHRKKLEGVAKICTFCLF